MVYDRQQLYPGTDPPERRAGIGDEVPGARLEQHVPIRLVASESDGGESCPGGSGVQRVHPGGAESEAECGRHERRERAMGAVSVGATDCRGLR